MDSINPSDASHRQKTLRVRQYVCKEYSEILPRLLVRYSMTAHRTFSETSSTSA